MYPELQKELETFERRTPKSAEAHKKNLKRLAAGRRQQLPRLRSLPDLCDRSVRAVNFRDLDGNEYIDHNLCFGALMAGHWHPAVVKAVQDAAQHGYDVWHAARHGVGTRGRNLHAFPGGDGAASVAGTEATMHAVRLARAATGRDKIIKFEGGYHGLHDSALVSVKPHPRRMTSAISKIPSTFPAAWEFPRPASPTW